MRTLLRIIVALLLVLVLEVTARAAVEPPQPVVVLAQKVRFGSSGGSLIGNCGIEKRALPEAKDRYTLPTGQAWVTRFEQGKALQPISLDEAINKQKWLEPPHPPRPGVDLLLRPSRAEEGVEYEVDIREPLPAIPNGEESKEISDFVKKLAASRSALKQLERIQELAGKLGDPKYFGPRDTDDFRELGWTPQSVIWALQPGAKQSPEQVETILENLRPRLEQLAKDPAVKQFVSEVQSIREVLRNSENPELAETFDSDLTRVTRDFVWGSSDDRGVVRKMWASLRDQLKRLSTDQEVKAFLADARKARSKLAELPSVDAQERASSELQRVLNSYVRGTAVERKLATDRLAAVRAALDWLMTNPAARRFYAEVEVVREGIRKLPDIMAVTEKAKSRLEDLSTDYVLSENRDQLSQELSVFRDRVMQLQRDVAFRGYEHVYNNSEITNLADNFLSSAAMETRDALLWDYAFGDELSRKLAQSHLGEIPKTYAGLAKDPLVQAVAGKINESRKTLARMRSIGSLALELDLHRVTGEFVLASPARRAGIAKYIEDLRHDVHQLETARSRQEAYEDPTVASASFDRGDASLQIGGRPKVQLKSLRQPDGKAVELPEELSGYVGRPLLVNARALSDQEYGVLVEEVQSLRRLGLNIHPCFQRSDQGQRNFQGMPHWNKEKVRLLGDSTSLDKLPERVRASVVEWLKKLASEWEQHRLDPRPHMPKRVELLVDHFDKEGESLKAIETRITNGDFVDSYVIAVLCNSGKDTMAAFLRLGDRAVREGKAKMFCFPAEVIQAPVAPLVVEEMMRFQAAPVVSPEDLPLQACQKVRRKLQRCLLEPDDLIEAALRKEFGDRPGRNPADLFRNNKGEFRPDIVKQMVNFLLMIEKGAFISVTLRESLAFTQQDV